MPVAIENPTQGSRARCRRNVAQLALETYECASELFSWPSSRCRAILRGNTRTSYAELVRFSPELNGKVSDLVQSVKAQGLEGLVAKRRDSYYEPGQRSGGDKFIYVARTRNGFTPRSREELFRRFHKLEIPKCPFSNLPEAKSGRWGQGLTKAKMAECQWLKPVLVGQFEFLEWTADNHLRHSKFVALREDNAGSR